MKPDGNILILRAKNAARSRMAEAPFRKHCGARTESERPKLSPGAAAGSVETRLTAFRDVRDGTERRILDWLRDPDVGLVGVRK